MLSSKERLLNSIKHKPIDRVPINAYEINPYNPIEGFYEDAYNDKNYKELLDAVEKYTDVTYMLPLNIKKGGFRHETETKNKNVKDSTFLETIIHTPKGDLKRVIRKDKNVFTAWTIEHTLKEIEDIDKYLSVPYDPWIVNMQNFYKEKEKLGSKGIMMIDLGDPINFVADLFGMSKFLILAVTETRKIKEFLDIFHANQIRELKKVLSKYDFEDVMFRIVGPEYATAPYLSPKYFNDFVTCYVKDMCQIIKEAKAIPRIHCHGNIGKVLEEFIKMGAEAIDPIEPPPNGDIELKEVKKRIGSEICLFGNIEISDLETASKEHIDILVKKAMDEAKQDSGFVIMPSTSPIKVPLPEKTKENYLQFFRSAMKYGKY